MVMYMFYVQLGINIKAVFWTSVNVMQTYGKKEEAPVAFSSFSAFSFFSTFFRCRRNAERFSTSPADA